MENSRYRLSSEPNIALPCADADKLITLGDGTAALVYLYVLRNGELEPASAAKALRRTEAEIKKATAFLCEAGLLKNRASCSAVPLPADELPEYTAEDIATRTGENGEFKTIVDETQRILGHMLTGADLKTLFGIYDYLRLPPEVIFLLINHCVEDSRERLGPGKLPSMRSIEREAYAWHNREILTFERAEEYLVRKREHSGAINDAKRILQINGRNLSTTEHKYVESWLEMGFDLEAIALAYDKTVVKTGNLAWKYMNSILTSWHGKNLHTAEQVLSGDAQGRSGQAVSQANRFPPATSKPRDDTELLKKLLSQSKNG